MIDSLQTYVKRFILASVLSIAALMTVMLAFAGTADARVHTYGGSASSGASYSSDTDYGASSVSIKVPSLHASSIDGTYHVALEDKTTGISVGSQFKFEHSKYAESENLYVNPGLSALHASGTCKACDKLRRMYMQGRISIYRTVVKPKNTFYDCIGIRVPKGAKVKAWQCKGHKHLKVRKTHRKGNIVWFKGSFAPFGVLITTKTSGADNKDASDSKKRRDKPHAYTPDQKKSVDSLRIVKHVRGSKTAKRFKFTLALKDSGGKPLKGSYRWSRTGKHEDSHMSGHISNGGSLCLGHNETVSVKGLPNGTQYEVMEASYQNYSVAGVKDGTGAIRTGKTAKVEFTNVAQSNKGKQAAVDSKAAGGSKTVSNKGSGSNASENSEASEKTESSDVQSKDTSSFNFPLAAGVGAAIVIATVLLRRRFKS